MNDEANRILGDVRDLLDQVAAKMTEAKQQHGLQINFSLNTDQEGKATVTKLDATMSVDLGNQALKPGKSN